MYLVVGTLLAETSPFEGGWAETAKPLNPDFSARLEALCGHLLGQEGVRLPGERRFMLRERNRVSGVNLPEALYNDLRKRAGVA